MAGNDEIELLVEVHHETDAAYLVSETGERDDAVWIPKSQIRGEAQTKGGMLELILPEWLAREKGFI